MNQHSPMLPLLLTADLLSTHFERIPQSVHDVRIRLACFTIQRLEDRIPALHVAYEFDDELISLQRAAIRPVLHCCNETVFAMNHCFRKCGTVSGGKWHCRSEIYIVDGFGFAIAPLCFVLPVRTQLAL